MSTNGEMDEKQRRIQETEEAELRMALALSAQLEEERLKLEAIADEPLPQPTPEPAAVDSPVRVSEPQPQPVAEAVSSPDAPSPSYPMPTSAVGMLAPLERRGAPALPNSQELRAAQTAANEAATRAAIARELAEKEREAARQAAMSQEMSVVRSAEVRARAEHLKKQRDLLVAKRKKEREEQFKAEPAATSSPPGRRGTSVEAVGLPPQSELKKSAGYSDERAVLSRALAANMKASLQGEDLGTLEAQRKAEFENTKAQLLAAKDRGL